jgi:hypothetical protein
MGAGQHRFKPPGGMTAFWLRGEKNEISCANGAELRDNGFDPGGLGFGMGSGKWTGRINSRLKPPMRSRRQIS